MLAGITIRTAYDMASERLGIDTKLTFAGKMDALVKIDRITSLDRSRLEAMVDAGSALAHCGWRPQPHDLETMMDVLGHFVYEAFVSPARKAKMDEAAAKMEGGAPTRLLGWRANKGRGLPGSRSIGCLGMRMMSESFSVAIERSSPSAGVEISSAPISARLNHALLQHLSIDRALLALEAKNFHAWTPSP